MSLSLFVYILHFIHISVLGFASQLRLQCQGAALALELSKGANTKTWFCLMTFPVFEGISAAQGWAVAVVQQRRIQLSHRSSWK